MASIQLSLPELRALAYQYMAKLLDYPYDDDIEKLPQLFQDCINLLKSLENLNPVYNGVSRYVEEALQLFKEEVEKLGRDMFQAEYVSTFELGVKGPLCPPYESEYVKPERIDNVWFEVPRIGGDYKSVYGLEAKLEIMSRVTSFYHSYGLDVKNMIPDHLLVELEFMYYLIHRECEAFRKGDEREAERYREAQLRFLKEHLTRWVGKLAECVSSRSVLKTYARLLEALTKLLEGDVKLLENLVSGVS